MLADERPSFLYCGIPVPVIRIDIRCFENPFGVLLQNRFRRRISAAVRMYVRVKIDKHVSRLYAAAFEQMLNTYLYPDARQHTAACKPRFIVERISRLFADIHCRKIDECGRCADRYRRERDVRIYCGEPYTDGKRVDARGDSLNEKQGRR